MENPFVSAVTPPPNLQKPALWFIFCGELLMVLVKPQTFSIPFIKNPNDIGITCVRSQYLGVLGNQHCFSGELEKETVVSKGIEFKNLRSLYSVLGDSLFTVAGRAKQIVEWERTNQFCGCCGMPTVEHHQERARVCSKCEVEIFPRLAPAIIVLISRGQELLLSRSPHFPPDMYSILAGFVEPGETLEQAVEREVMEEVKLRVRNIRYLSSQPWPFPHSLMIGFRAEYAGGKIEIHPTEIEDAMWCNINNLPLLPPNMSIARRLIDGFIGEVSSNSNTTTNVS